MKIAVCNRNTEKRYKNKEMSWEDIKERNRHPIRTSETVEEYPKLPKAQRDIERPGWLCRRLAERRHSEERSCHQQGVRCARC